MNKYVVYVHGKPLPIPDISCSVLFFDNLNQLIDAINPEIASNVIVVSADKLNNVNFGYLFSIDYQFEMLHAGLKTGMVASFNELQVIALSWFFLNPDSSVKSVSWKADQEFFVINTNAFKAIGGINLNYESWSVRVADLSYSLLRRGGKVFYDPMLIAGSWADKKIPERDLFRFIRCHINSSAALFYLFFVLRYNYSFISSIVNFISSKKIKTASKVRFVWSTKEKVKSVTDYSVIIPTLDRYAYLPAAVQSLFDQDFPPDDIVVYDQTPVERRNKIWNAKFDSDRVRVVFSDKPGQSTARNEALKRTKHEWCLLFDDDSLAMSDMASSHRHIIENTNFKVSTGASLAPGQSFKDLPYDIDFFHLTDVLDSGNCFIHKSLWKDIKGFDPAFDRGPGADNDFGTRLYLRGEPIVFNNKAVRIHYKAKTGGLRNYGVWWRFKTSFRDPYPPPSQTYTVMKYYDQRFWSFIFLRFFLKSSYRQNFFRVTFLWLLYPIKLITSKRRARKLMIIQKSQ